METMLLLAQAAGMAAVAVILFASIAWATLHLLKGFEA